MLRPTTAFFALCCAASSVARPIASVRLDGEVPPKPTLLAKTLAGFVGQEPAEASLEALADAVVAHYRACGRSVVLVSVDPELTAEGTVEVFVKEGMLVRAQLAGGKHLHTTAWAKATAELVGKPLARNEAQEVLDWIQRNPFAGDTTLSLTSESELTDVSLTFQVPDRRAWQASLSFANDGVQPLGQSRWKAGLAWGNVWGLGHRMSVDYTMGDSPDTFASEALNYAIPLPWRHEISVAAAHSSSNAQVDGIDIRGDAWLGSLRYTVPWRAGLAWKYSAYLGWDYKNFDTDLTFGGTQRFAQPLETSSYVFGISQAYEQGRTAWGSQLELACSLGRQFSSDTDADYAAVVAGADSAFQVLRGNVWWKQETQPGWTFQTRLSAQWASGPLLPSEDATVVGMNAVRGYLERSLLGKHALWGGCDVFLPQRKVTGLSFRPLAFCDAGHAWQSNAAQADQFVASTGIGLLASWRRCQLRGEAAWPLRDGDGARFHLQASLSF
jgi:hemolysin activation/secretion protein